MNIPYRSVRFGLMLSAASLVTAASFAAAPPAGSKIGNQASATYLNASGDTVTVTSNKVETIVQQVAGLTVLTDKSESVAPGGKVFLPHTISNDGNGIDIFDLTAVDANVGGGGYDFTSIQIYPDADFNGVADSTTPISVTPALAAGETFGVVIEASVPSGAAPSSSEDITVTATSQFSNTIFDTNTDTVTVSTGPITEIVKSMTVDKGADGKVGPGDLVTITLTYSSTGLAPANDLVVTDQLDALLEYTTGSGSWSDSATGLQDTDDADNNTYELSNGSGHQIDYAYDGTDTVSFRLDTVPAGRTGSVTFTATIAANAPVGDIPNDATQTVGGTPFPPSNEAKVTVEPVYQITAADAASNAYQADPDGANLVAGTESSTDDDSARDDVVTESADVYQGGTVTFEFVVTNQSNDSDSVDLNFSNTSFPAGTTFQLVGSDGASPIVGPIGPLTRGESTTVNLIATLPPNATPTATTNYEATLTAQSINGGTSNSVTGRFTGEVLGATVDLENTNGTGDGPNPTDPGGNPWIDFATDPGQPVTYPVTIQNTGPTADTYDLTLSTPLPTGWTVEFQLPDGTPVTNTGSIPGTSSQQITVVVTPPAGSPPIDQPVTVSVLSPSTGQGDTLTNAVVVNEIVDLSITPDQTVQIAPGGIADIPHTLLNDSNIAITEGAISVAGFTSFNGTLYHDVNDDGQVDSGDVIIDNVDDIGSIAPGASVPLLLRVQVPSTGTVGLSESETISVATSLNSGSKTDGDTTDNSVTDTVIIVAGDLTLQKEQALDVLCDGTTGAFGTAQLQAEPGQCVRYRITANNSGTNNAGSVTIRDTVPGYTTFTECTGSACSAAVTPAGSTVTVQPAEGATGAMESTHGTLLPGQPATLEFTVKVNE